MTGPGRPAAPPGRRPARRVRPVRVPAPRRPPAPVRRTGREGAPLPPLPPAAEGQAAVELALVLPLLVVLALVLLQVGLVVRDQVLVVHAAREAARAAAVDPSAAAARRAALAGGPLDPHRLEVRVTAGGRGRPVGVSLVYRSPTMAPLVGPLLPDVRLTGQASMRREY
ncbi:MAG TPA: TadE/TadG family type IV pilus assembly protein [Acidimicrobiales bacterium]|nr:TadE/TadG family type IV pilus assembly protein [Acidimicrobiales bacterium]